MLVSLCFSTRKTLLFVTQKQDETLKNTNRRKQFITFALQKRHYTTRLMNYAMEIKATEQATQKSKNYEEIDGLRCVCILLVVSFHIVYIEQRYSAIYAIVGIFHVPVFLIISGYLANVERPLNKLWKSISPWVISYAIMESLYILAASHLPVSDHINGLSFSKFADLLLLHPIGIYWYLHTLLLCYSFLNFSRRITKLSKGNQLVVFLTLCFVSNSLGILSVTNSLYFLFGALLRNYGFRMDSFQPSIVAVLPVLWIIYSSKSKPVLSSSLLGFVFVILTICVLVVLLRRVSGCFRKLALTIGRNTLPILLFSPIFTFLAKSCQIQLLDIDPSGILFLFLTLVFTCSASLLIWKVVSYKW